MKKLMLLMIAFALGTGLMAQGTSKMNKKGRKGDSQKFEAMKIAHLTKALDLTPEVAEKFWPVYNKYTDQKKGLRQDNRPEKKFEDMSQVEAEAFVERTLASRTKASELDVAMHEDLKGVLSATQRMKLIKAEENFHQSVVRHFKKRHKGQRGEERKEGKGPKEIEKGDE